MNKTAIKNFAVEARKKLIADTIRKAAYYGVTEHGVAERLPQSNGDIEFYDVGLAKPVSVSGVTITQRRSLVARINDKAKSSDYKTAFNSIIEEVAYTWFNRLIAVRFMEVNDYLPIGMRVLSSDDKNKLEPDFVTRPFDAADMEFTAAEKQQIAQMKDANKLTELFQLLFIKQCNELNKVLPRLFEKLDDYTELLLAISFSDKEGIVYKLVHEIDEKDWKDAVQIIGWLYQYYNSELKDETFALLKKNVKVTKERIPSATQLFTPDWIVRYMVENSLGRLWYEGHKDEELKAGWKYYLDEAQQEPEVAAQLAKIREGYKMIKPEAITVIDPCMGSGHILVYAFDLLMQIYLSAGWNKREAAQSILKNNLYGLDIDDRAAQLAYFAVMMKARRYDRQALSREIQPNVYPICESNGVDPSFVDYFANGDKSLKTGIDSVIKDLHNAKEYGSIIDVSPKKFYLLYQRLEEISRGKNVLREEIVADLLPLINIAEILAQKYDVVVTNPPYMGSSNMNEKLSTYVKKNYTDSKTDLFAVFIERCGRMTKQGRYQAMITQHAWMFLSSYEKLREKLQEVETINMAHLGPRAFDEIGGEVVQTTSFVFWNGCVVDYKGTYCRLIGPITESEKESKFIAGEDRYITSQKNFSKIPGSSIAYWVNNSILLTYTKGILLGTIASPKTGMTTGDNNKFIRHWYEVNINNVKFDAVDKNDAIMSSKKWFSYCKGGGFKRYYGYYDYVVNWWQNGKEIKNNIKNNGLKAASVRSENLYFKKLISWSAVTSSYFSCRIIRGALFDSGGSSIFTNNEPYFILALLNSKIGQLYLNIYNSTMNYQPGDIANIPVIFKHNVIIYNDVSNNINIAKNDWDSFETSWDFAIHPLARNTTIFTIEKSYCAWKGECEDRFTQLKANEEELNRIFIDIYGLQDELTPEVADKDVTVARVYDSKEDIPESMKGNGYVLTKADVVKSFISYAVGCIFGRYSLDCERLAFAGGDWDAGKYKTYLPDADNCVPITDDEYFEDDIVTRFADFVKAVYGADTLDENLAFIADALGVRGGSARQTIREYFLNDFFKDHCKTYQKRPIYWLFDSGKENGFKALFYLHRYNADNIGNMRIEYLRKMQVAYERAMAVQKNVIESTDDAREKAKARKILEKLMKQANECRLYDEKVGHLANERIELDLDDGVKVNYEKLQTDRNGKKFEILGRI